VDDAAEAVQAAVMVVEAAAEEEAESPSRLGLPRLM